MQKLHAFPPIVRSDAHTLILGSMPGAASLAAREYYAHPRNLFWPMISELLGFSATLSYRERTRALTTRGFALWDVLAACRRNGSLDTDIDPESVEINDFSTFFTEYPHIERVFFNGLSAEQLFRRHCRNLMSERTTTRFVRLPSTSPAHATIDRTTKFSAWRVIVR